MNQFEGMYYKHQKGGHTIALIAGRAADHAFIQLITNQTSHCFDYPLSQLRNSDRLKIGGSSFSRDGIELNIKQGPVLICGRIKYTGQTPLRYDIMGPYKFFALQCRHKIESLHHRLEGSLNINGTVVDLTGGVGYIEGDSGTSFPKRYAWIHCNDFPGKACITVSVADIPFMGGQFQGCICVVYLGGREYRMATYLGVKILCCNENRISLRQRGLRLEIEIDPGAGHRLLAPEGGKMIREIRERIVCGAGFRFFEDGNLLLDQRSENASFEYLE